MESPRLRDSGIRIARGMVCTSPRVRDIRQRRAVLKWLGGFLSGPPLWMRGELLVGYSEISL